MIIIDVGNPFHAGTHLIKGGIPTEALLAQIAVSKYADGLLPYRQEAICPRPG